MPQKPKYLIFKYAIQQLLQKSFFARPPTKEEDRQYQLNPSGIQFSTSALNQCHQFCQINRNKHVDILLCQFM